MPLAMNREVFITCAVTGSGGTQDRSPHVPRSPEQIAKSAIDAAKAGAAIVHCHVRDPETGKPSRDPKLYREVTERIRDSATDVVLNLTAGMGGDMVFGDVENPLPLKAGTDMGGAPTEAFPYTFAWCLAISSSLRHRSHNPLTGKPPYPLRSSISARFNKCRVAPPAPMNTNLALHLPFCMLSKFLTNTSHPPLPSGSRSRASTL